MGHLNVVQCWLQHDERNFDSGGGLLQRNLLGLANGNFRFWKVALLQSRKTTEQHRVLGYSFAILIDNPVRIQQNPTRLNQHRSSPFMSDFCIQRFHFECEEGTLFCPYTKSTLCHRLT